ncbi:MAG: DUF1684 domain-containing protein [Bacteroidetes bacterium]|nr:DUF1684 domain-containing protein [Bacteroidota bacterium]
MEGKRKPASGNTAVERERAEKDSAFRGPGSPIPEGVRPTFTGLRYYPVAPALAFNLHLTRLSKPEPISIPASKGDLRSMVRAGTFVFSVEGVECRLTAFASPEQPGLLFIPFRDATNSSETYEGGRYLDLEETAGDEYLLDFNRAYNPYCAYSPHYTCPLVPKENVLSVAIRAGEMLPPFDAHAVQSDSKQ